MTKGVGVSATEAQTEYNPTWKPEAGDTITGKLVSGTVIPSKYKKPDGTPKKTMILTLDKGDGELMDVFVNSEPLQEKIAERKPQEGSELSITYHGLRESKMNPGQSYHHYTLNGGGTAHIDWGQFLSPEKRERFSVPTAAEVAAAEPDIPIDTSDLPDPIHDDDIPF